MNTQILKLYENRPDVTLTTYLLADSPELLNGKMRPAVIVCPGGAYLNCSDREAEPVALRFAAMGYHAFVLRYSTYYKGEAAEVPPPVNMEVNPNSMHPGPLRDLGKAFLTIRAHAEEWLVDVDKIAICGFSAGGHNCAMYSVYWQNPVLSDFFGEDPAVFKPAAAILSYALCDYRVMFGEIKDPFAQMLSNAASIALMGTASPSPELLDILSPTLHVTRNTPPTFLWATSSDELVPVENSTRMATALAQAGVPFEMHIFEQGSHGLSLADQSTTAYPFWLNADAEKWIGLADAWLKKRFALPLEPTPAWLSGQMPPMEAEPGAAPK